VRLLTGPVGERLNHLDTFRATMTGYLLLLALRMAGADPAPTPEEIVVTAKRISQVRYAMKIHRKSKVTQCWITRSSGDARIDWQVCEMAKGCVFIEPLTRENVQACMRERRKAFLQTYKPEARAAS
jgi:hypothetical protein